MTTDQHHHSAIADFVHADRNRIFTELSEIVAFNSVHSTPELAEENAGAAAWVYNTVSAAGFEVEALETEDGSTSILGTRAGDPDAPTVLLYSHFDVVPAGDLSAWESDPFSLTERPGPDGAVRWYGRGAADDKGGIVMHLAALRAVDALGGTKLNLKFLVEGSEELGGFGLSRLINSRPELFAADVIMIADSGNVAVGTPTLTTSLRGGAQIKITVDTLKAAVHSGSFGGPAPDAVKALVRALDSLHDEYGRVTVDGLDATGTWDGEPYAAQTFREDAAVLDGVSLMGGPEDQVADLVWARPSLAITGFSSTPVAQAVNAVAATASAQLNLRVPAGMDSAAAAEAVAKHLEAHVPWGAKVRTEVFDINRGFATDPTKPALALFSDCLSQAYDAPTVTTGAGGSIPLTVELQDHYPNAEIALYGATEPRCTIHSPNESVDPTEIEHIAIAEALFLLRHR